MTQNKIGIFNGELERRVWVAALEAGLRALGFRHAIEAADEVVIDYRARCTGSAFVELKSTGVS